jgi:hypothetical protein
MAGLEKTTAHELKRNYNAVKVEDLQLSRVLENISQILDSVGSS